MPRPRFTALPFFAYPVRDMDRARKFYEGILGLQVTANWEDKFVEYDIGNGTLALSTVLEGCTPGARGGVAALETDDFDGVVAHLRECHVEFIFGPHDTGVCHFARFLDPDGNHLGLHRKHPDGASGS
jgi:catechol 2,3-dioxygenase-like lactoylglutathione lyase family enzyme